MTKSALITRDIELLGRIHARSRLHIGISLITPYRSLDRRLNPRAPTPERRLRTVQSLAATGLDVSVLALPILPSINDSTRDLELLFRRSKAYEARWISVGPLFLASGSRRHFLAWLADAMPRKLPIYRHLFARGIDVDPRWERGLRRRVAVLRRRTGLPEGSVRSREPASLQLALPGLDPTGRPGFPGGLHSSP